MEKMVEKDMGLILVVSLLLGISPLSASFRVETDIVARSYLLEGKGKEGMVVLEWKDGKWKHPSVSFSFSKNQALFSFQKGKEGFHGWTIREEGRWLRLYSPIFDPKSPYAVSMGVGHLSMEAELFFWKWGKRQRDDSLSDLVKRSSARDSVSGLGISSLFHWGIQEGEVMLYFHPDKGLEASIRWLLQWNGLSAWMERNRDGWLLSYGGECVHEKGKWRVEGTFLSRIGTYPLIGGTWQKRSHSLREKVRWQEGKWKAEVSVRMQGGISDKGEDRQVVGYGLSVSYGICTVKTEVRLSHHVPSWRCGLQVGDVRFSWNMKSMELEASHHFPVSDGSFSLQVRLSRGGLASLVIGFTTRRENGPHTGDRSLPSP